MEFFDSLWNYIVLSAPYLLFGLALAGLFHEFMPMKKVQKWLGGENFSTVLKGALVGVPLPLCSCSVIPSAVELRKNGASNASTSAFLISTPESGVDSISLTYALIDLPMAIIRPLAAFFSALFAGLLQLRFNPTMKLEGIEKTSKQPCCSKSHSSTGVEKKEYRFFKAIKYGYGRLLNDIALWLTIGIFAGAMIDYLVPNDFFLIYAKDYGRFFILLIGVPLYICATASTPIAISLMLKGLSPGAALILLLVGPATNISNLAVLQKYIGKKGILINLMSIIFIALIFSYLTDWAYGNLFELKLKESLIKHHHESHIIEGVLGSILVGLLLKGICVEEVFPRFKNKFSIFNS